MILQAKLWSGDDQPGVGVGDDEADRFVVFYINKNFTERIALHIAVNAKGLSTLPVLDSLVDVVRADSDVALPAVIFIFANSLIDQDEFCYLAVCR